MFFWGQVATHTHQAFISLENKFYWSFKTAHLLLKTTHNLHTNTKSSWSSSIQFIDVTPSKRKRIWKTKREKLEWPRNSKQADQITITSPLHMIFFAISTINQASISISTFAYRIYCTPHGKFIRDLDNNMAKRKSLCTVGASTNTLFFHYVNIFHGHTILSLFLSLFLKVTSAPFQYLIASWNWFTHWFTLDWEVRKVRKNRCSFSMKSIHDALHSATERV